MKKTILVLICLISFNVVAPPKASAIFCSNCSTWVTQLIEYALQGKEYISQVSQELSEYMTYYKLVTTDPMTALFGVNAGKQIESETRKWLMSGFQGSPLIVQNPEAYIKNSYTNAVRNEILKLEAQKTPATEGIITRLIKQRRAELTKAPAEVRSNIPATIQKDLCENGGIERIVENEIGGPIDLSQGSDSAARVQELYNEFCTTLDPNTKEGAQKLLAVQKNSAYFSWDSFLAMTGGDNDYARQVQTILEVNRRAEEKKKLAEEESKTGYLPDKKCVEYRPALDDVGNPIEGEEECISYQIINPAEEVKALATQLKQKPLTDASLSSIKEQVLGAEALAGLGDLFKGVQDIISTAQEIGQVVGEVGQAVGQVMDATGQLVGIVEGTAGALGAGGNPNTARVNLIGTTNTSYGTIASSTYVNRGGIATSTQTSDGSTQAERDAISNPMKETIRRHQTAMSKVPEKLSQISSVTNQYKGYISSVRSCVQSITTDPNYQQASDRPSVTDFTNRVNIKEEEGLNPVLEIVAAVRQKVPITNNYLSTLLTTIASVKNIASLLSLTQEYQRKLGDGSILPLQADQQLDIVMLQSVEPLSKDINPQEGQDASETIKVLLEDCQNYLQQVRARGGVSGG